MQVYFDTSCLSRPLDDCSIPRNEVERAALLEMFEMARRGEIDVIISDVVLDEIRKTPNEERREMLEELLSIASTTVQLTDKMVQRGIELQAIGFRAFDALHLAAAEAAGVDWLCTADDRFKKKSQKEKNLKVGVVLPLELFQELEQ